MAPTPTRVGTTARRRKASGELLLHQLLAAAGPHRQDVGA
jgi:hypothetical protein